MPDFVFIEIFSYICLGQVFFLGVVLGQGFCSASPFRQFFPALFLSVFLFPYFAVDGKVFKKSSDSHYHIFFMLSEEGGGDFFVCKIPLIGPI